MERVKLYKGDCVEVMRGFEDKCIDLTVTSPPYDDLRSYKNTCEWNFDVFKNVANELYRITKDGGVVVWVVGDATINGSETGTSFKQALYFKEIGFNLHDTMIYEKNSSAFPARRDSKRYTQIFEYMFVLSKGVIRSIKGYIWRSKPWNEPNDSTLVTTTVIGLGWHNFKYVANTHKLDWNKIVVEQLNPKDIGMRSDTNLKRITMPKFYLNYFGKQWREKFKLKEEGVI